ncbi:MAG: hypothetical protein KatS3mg038_3751 [Candidatus Kapaibacterium sp.]|nr:MAG: hypothetical protein KatS3mg038_3751 [Candidatus Kapabacteria bacterium]
MERQSVTIFWFRRDLRLEDNRGLQAALQSPYPVVPVFIFDSNNPRSVSATATIGGSSLIHAWVGELAEQIARVR